MSQTVAGRVWPHNTTGVKETPEWPAPVAVRSKGDVHERAERWALEVQRDHCAVRRVPGALSFLGYGVCDHRRDVATAIAVKR